MVTWSPAVARKVGIQILPRDWASVINGGFETGDLTGWVVAYVTPIGALNYLVSEDAAYSGNYGLKVEGALPYFGGECEIYNDTGWLDTFEVKMRQLQPTWDRYCYWHPEVCHVNNRFFVDGGAIATIEINNTPDGSYLRCESHYDDQHSYSDWQELKNPWDWHTLKISNFYTKTSFYIDDATICTLPTNVTVYKKVFLYTHAAYAEFTTYFDDAIGVSLYPHIYIPIP
jgi:hypothetical protein